MSQNGSAGTDLSPAFVKSQFDEILAAEVISLIEIDSELALLTYNLATLTCILIAVEREREIKLFSDSPPERFTRQTFIDELVDIGLDRGDTLMQALQSVLDQGYLSVTENGGLKAEVAAYTLVGFLDTIFPGMQGMNLIAFVLQMSDEVLSGRKSLETAKAGFAQTLKSRGVAVSRQKAEEKASELARKPSGPRTDVAAKLKEANKKRLSGLKFKKSGAKPSVYSTEGYTPEKVQIKTLFDQETPETEAAATAKAVERQIEEARARTRELEEREARLKEAEERALELEVREKELLAAQEAVREAEKKALEIRAMEAEMALREAELKAREERLKGTPDVPGEAGGSPGKKEGVSEPEDIESRIAAFEAELSTPCPICSTGRIIQETTAKGKDYFTCDKDGCRFVSWDKPYHFTCPMCKNPFLTETRLADGGIGLKCPRAACSFTQDSISDPAAAQDAAPKKRKKKVVRRVKKRS